MPTGAVAVANGTGSCYQGDTIFWHSFGAGGCWLCSALLAARQRGIAAADWAVLAHTMGQASHTRLACGPNLQAFTSIHREPCPWNTFLCHTPLLSVAITHQSRGAPRALEPCRSSCSQRCLLPSVPDTPPPARQAALFFTRPAARCTADVLRACCGPAFAPCCELPPMPHHLDECPRPLSACPAAPNPQRCAASIPLLITVAVQMMCASLQLMEDMVLAKGPLFDSRVQLQTPDAYAPSSPALPPTPATQSAPGPPNPTASSQPLAAPSQSMATPSQAIAAPSQPQTAPSPAPPAAAPPLQSNPSFGHSDAVVTAGAPSPAQAARDGGGSSGRDVRGGAGGRDEGMTAEGGAVTSRSRNGPAESSSLGSGDNGGGSSRAEATAEGTQQQSQQPPLAASMPSAGVLPRWRWWQWHTCM